MLGNARTSEQGVKGLSNEYQNRNKRRLVHTARRFILIRHSLIKITGMPALSHSPASPEAAKSLLVISNYLKQ